MINHLQTHQDVPELIGGGTHVAWERVQRDAQLPRGVSPKTMLDEAHNSGMSVSQFLLSLVNHAIRDGASVVVDKKYLMDLAMTISVHHGAEEGLLSVYGAAALQSSPQPA